MKNHLIIGASSGIGLALAQKFEEKKFNVFGTYNQTKPEPNSGIHYEKINVLDENLDLSFLPEKLHGVIYCPGRIELKPFHRITPNQFSEDYELQTVGAVKIIQSVLPNLKKGHGSVVLFSTVAVKKGFNFHSMVSASKGAVEGLTRALSAEFAPIIRVNCIAPSLTDTPLAERLLNTEQKREANAERHPLKRYGSADDVAECAAFLISEKSSWITGQIIGVDGGIGTIKQ
jgi:NAD(P)-dependent dehydrogenase (short-subunit alcohol dehydrogenase family)